MPSSYKQIVYRRTLASGTINITRHAGDHALEDLFDIAERRNPKRAFLFVSKVLGRHIPISPAVMRRTYQQLAAQFPATLFTEPANSVLFIGMAETAVGLGAGVFDELQPKLPNAVYLTSTRHPIAADILCEFKENHSHATDHIIYLPHDAELRRRVVEARTLVLIDDEATTGNTFINLLEALLGANKVKHIEQIFAVTLTDWSNDALAKRYPLLPVHSLSLVKGSWQWEPKPNAPVPIMPAVNVTATGKEPMTGKQSWGRLGMACAARDLGPHITTQSGEKILVLGSNEFIWEPFLLAERLQTAGADVLFGSTTRSPIATGFAIESAIGFTDNYGLGIPNFVYNLNQQKVDRILLCIETRPSSVDPQLLSALATIAPITEVISYQ